MNRPRSLSPVHGLAALLSLFAAGAALWIGVNVFEGLPHLEDEFAYVWQAEAMAGGRLTAPTPPSPRHFLVPFVVDIDGQRFGKYPLGWPAALGIGVRLGVEALINPLMAGLAVWLTYRLGARVMGQAVGLLAALLTATSPFLLLNAGTLLSHTMGLALSAAFALSWLDAFAGPASERSRRLPVWAAGLSMGLLALSRPLTAVAVAFPFAVHGAYLLLQGDAGVRRRLLLFGVLAGGLAGLHFLWQFAATGDPWLNLYTLWWPYDKVGFGPGVGRYGHTLRLAVLNTRFSLRAGWRDLFGWGTVSWLFLPVGLWAVRRNWRTLLLGAVAPSLVLAYMAYWVGAWVFGPRYYLEGLYSATLLSAAGIAWLAGWPLEPGVPFPRHLGRARLRPLGATALLALLMAGNLLFYLPARVGANRGLYGIERTRLAPFQAAADQGLTPALVFVHPSDWREYGNLQPLTDPFLRSPFLITISQGAAADADLAAAFPGRSVFHYFPNSPYTFFTPQVQGED